MAKPKVIFHVGGPEQMHPATEQARCVAQWLGEDYDCELHDGIDAFDRLEAADLLVVMGMHWTGMTGDNFGNLTYRPPEARHKQALEDYAAAGKPIVAHHAGVSSYDDWPRFAELVGWQWVWGQSTHSPFDTWTIRVLDDHPTVTELRDFEIEDELYYQIRVAEGLDAQVHAVADYEGMALPMVSTAEPAMGRRVYLANGHDMRTFACPALKRLWESSVRWALGQA